MNGFGTSHAQQTNGIARRFSEHVNDTVWLTPGRNTELLQVRG